MTVKRKEEKRKEVEEYVKVMSNILKIDGKVKDGLLKAFQKAWVIGEVRKRKGRGVDDCVMCNIACTWSDLYTVSVCSVVF